VPRGFTLPDLKLVKLKKSGFGMVKVTRLPVQKLLEGILKSLRAIERTAKW
jgi:hypothetical protein